jgi:hypothetical protein
MRCLSCDEVLTEYEQTRRYAGTPEFLDLCLNCSEHTVNIQLEDREDLRVFTVDYDEEDYDSV